jgi:hypothetical protein
VVAHGHWRSIETPAHLELDAVTCTAGRGDRK